MGTPQFAVPALEALIQAGHQVVAVYSQPPKPQGRGHKVQPSPVQATAEQYQIPVFTPKRLRSLEAQSDFQNLKADIAVVAAYGLILPKAILEAPVYGCLNIHASILPRWRGAAPIHRALLAGDTTTGITIMKMDEGLDTGDMIKVKTIDITSTTTTPELFEQLSHLGAEALIEVLQDLPQSLIQATPQPLTGVTYALKLTKEEGRLDWTNSADFLDRQIRALNPWPGTYFWLEGSMVKVRQAHPVFPAVEATPGHIIDACLTVACQTGALQLTEVQMAGKKPQSGAEFMNGHRLKVGQVSS